MSIALQVKTDVKVVEVTVGGKLVKEDYAKFVPAIDQLVQQQQQIRVLLLMNDFHGWTAGALWEDTKFTVNHFSAIERLALVGEKKWQHGMAVFCKPFTKATVRYFEHGDLDKARAWLAEE